MAHACLFGMVAQSGAAPLHSLLQHVVSSKCVEMASSFSTVAKYAVNVTAEIWCQPRVYLRYWMTHESLMNEQLDRAITTLVEGADKVPHDHIISELAGTIALQFLQLRLARGYNMLDVEIMRSSWKGSQGQRVCRSQCAHTGPHEHCGFAQRQHMSYGMAALVTMHMVVVVCVQSVFLYT